MKLGTRGSALALWQARTVAQLIEQTRGPQCEIVVIRTSGDGPPDSPDVPGTSGTLSPPSTPGTSGTPGTLGTLGTLGSESVKRTFVKELEDALLDGHIDLAVHSAKDLAADLPAGLILGAALARADARDAVLLPGGERVADVDALRKRLTAGARIGTSSVRRAAQLSAVLTGAAFVPIRGNVDTRLRKLDAGECDALVLAAAGLQRLGLSARISLTLPLEVSLPAPGQGIIIVQIRNDRPELSATMSAVSDAATMDALTAERALVRALGGGCQMPLGGHAGIRGGEITIQAVVMSPDGARAIRSELQGRRSDAASTGEQLGRRLLEQGAGELLGVDFR